MHANIEMLPLCQAYMHRKPPIRAIEDWQERDQVTRPTSIQATLSIDSLVAAKLSMFSAGKQPIVAF